MGVKQMYKEFITHCHRELKQALMIFVNPDNYPIHIHCTQGKDRTGLLSALILLIAGVPEDVIVNDYAKTQREFAPIYDAVVEDVRKAGLTEDFAQAPPQNMRETLEYINTEYGSAIGFMDAIGFDEDLRERVRNIICS
ncbi:protein-tyrosine phosphatase-like protein [Pilobolus umbonatus]|nr:protein-tyrosine phosphatase-like protein [Pilobolus umbonatus]